MIIFGHNPKDWIINLRNRLCLIFWNKEHLIMMMVIIIICLFLISCSKLTFDPKVSVIKYTLTKGKK